MTTHIVFDLGRVIIDQPITIAQETVKTMFGDIYDKAYPLWQKYRKDICLGKITSYDFLSLCKNELGLDGNISDLYEKWKHAYGVHAKVNTVVLSLIDDLRKKYTIDILTDTIDAHFEYATSLGIFDHVDHVFASHREGFLKEDGEAFSNMLTQLAVPAEEIVFIDDVERNVTSAKGYGMKAILFTIYTQLKKDLETLQIL